jgi:hypothetical protein
MSESYASKANDCRYFIDMYKTSDDCLQQGPMNLGFKIYKIASINEKLE